MKFYVNTATCDVSAAKKKTPNRCASDNAKGQLTERIIEDDSCTGDILVHDNLANDLNSAIHGW